MIMTNSRSFPSARALAREISSITGMKWGLTDNPEIAVRGRGKLIRFGNSEDVHGIPSNCNSPEFIQLCAFKLRFSKHLIENGVYTPIYHSSGKPVNYPALIRTTMSGFGGQGIIRIFNDEQYYRYWREGYHWTDYIPTASEYRVHVLGGNILKIFKKVCAGYEENAVPIRNSHSGYHFSLRDPEIHDFVKMRELVESLKPVLTGKFYGLDAGWDAEKKDYVVFEANSAPGLNKETARDYANFICNELR